MDKQASSQNPNINLALTTNHLDTVFRKRKRNLSPKLF
jgi:hypothetical protein